MKNLLLFFAFLTGSSLYSQQKGVAPLSPAPALARSPAATRAVVIGISDYQDPAIPDLRFADRDAEAFATWLSSGQSGLPNAAVKTLLNEQATTGNIVAALSGLISASKAGDLAIIYFSGHGDVEQVTKYQRGYWLTYNSPPAVYAAGAFSLVFLQDIVTTLAEGGVKVVVISDACRAGKLAGSEFGGAQATAAALSKQYANEVKILSCQPNEFSLESEQWGEGRGVFSYHLLDALYGMADQDEDGRVTVKELGRYLEDHIAAEAAPHRQNPLVLGDREMQLARVNPEALAQKRKQLAGDPVVLKKIDSRNFEDLALAKADSSLRNLYEAFVTALERGNLMPTDSTAGQSANDYYERLINEPSLADLYGLMTRNFAAALMDEGQQFINKLLQTNQLLIQQVLGAEFDYEDIAMKTAKAAALLGEKHFVYSALKTKENFFRGAAAKNKQDFSSAKQFGLEALRYDPEAAYVYFFMTTLCKGDSLKMMVNKVDELSPSWVFGQAAVAMSLFANQEYRLSLKHSLKAISLDPDFLIPYGRTMANYYALHLPDSARIWEAALGEKVLSKVKNKAEKIYPIECLFGGSSLSTMNRFRDADLVFKRGLELTPNPNYALPMQWNMAYNYANQGMYSEAVAILDSTKHQFVLPLFQKWVILCFYLANDKMSLKTMQDLLPRDDLSIGMAVKLSISLLKGNQFAQADSLVQPQLINNPNDAQLLFQYAASRQGLGDHETATRCWRRILDSTQVEFYRKENSWPNYLFHLLAMNRLGQNFEADALVERVKTAMPGDGWAYFWLACYYAQMNELPIALKYLELSENAGWVPNPAVRLEGTVKDPLLDSLRSLREFQSWEKRWSPPYQDYSLK